MNSLKRRLAVVMLAAALMTGVLVGQGHAADGVGGGMGTFDHVTGEYLE